MGSSSNEDHLLPFLTKQDFDQAFETMTRTIQAMASRGTPFKGILYGCFMATNEGPKLLEFNVRFADPESMNVLPICEGDFLDLCGRLAAGNLAASVKFAHQATVCKYVVPMGYGSRPKAGEQIKGDGKNNLRTGAKLFFSSGDAKGRALYTNTARVLALVSNSRG